MDKHFNPSWINTVIGIVLINHLHIWKNWIKLQRNLKEQCYPTSVTIGDALDRLPRIIQLDNLIINNPSNKITRPVKSVDLLNFLPQLSDVFGGINFNLKLGVLIIVLDMIWYVKEI